MEISVPAQLTTTRNNFAVTCVKNNNIHPLKIRTNLIRKTQPLYQITSSEINPVELTNDSSNKHNSHPHDEVSQLIGTDHLNTMEKEKIFEVCNKFLDIFQSTDKLLTFLQSKARNRNNR